MSRRLLFAATAAVTAVAIILAALIAAGVEEKRPVAASAEGPVEMSGVTYGVAGSRPLSAGADRGILEALAPRARPARADGREQLYGVFLDVTNRGEVARPVARRYRLVDSSGRSFAPLAVRSSSPFSLPRSVGPGREEPAGGSPPDVDVAEGGYPLVFSLPRDVVRRDDLVLQIFDPSDGGPPAALLVQT